MPGILPWGQKCELGSLLLYKLLVLSQKTVMKITNRKGLAREGALLLTVFRTAVPVNLCFPTEKLNSDLRVTLTNPPRDPCLSGKEEGRFSQSEGWEGSLGPAPGGWNHSSTG